MVVCDKIYLEAYINKEYICVKNNSAQLDIYFILKSGNQRWNVS